jgi:hypothetical protein
VPVLTALSVGMRFGEEVVTGAEDISHERENKEIEGKK